mgnify:CR=1 FL=1
MSDTRTEDTPPAGTRWTALIPRWVKLVAPLVTVLIAIFGFALGLGEGRGASAETIRTQAVVLARHTEQIARLESGTSRLEGKVDALLAYFRIPAPKEP